MKTFLKEQKTNQIYQTRTQYHFYKIYPKDILLESFEKVEIRLNLIKKVIQYYFDYEWTETNLILKSKLFKGKHQPLNKLQLKLLAIYLDGIHSKDIFHGDIHVRNIFIDNDKPILVDWEPCTLQQINSKKIIKSHSRGIALKDRKIKKISPLTDKKGFLKLISEKVFSELADTFEMENFTCRELLDYHSSS